MKLATSELLSTFFPTWLWQGMEWSKWRIPKYDHFYWGNAHALPVLSTYYPLSILGALASRLTTNLDKQFKCYCGLIYLHFGWAYYLYAILIQSWSKSGPVALFGASVLTFGAISLRQQPCIVYTLACFPLTLYQNPVLSILGVGMMLLAGYYPFAAYLIPISILAHLYWYHEAWLLLGFFIGLPQLIPFLKHLPNTIKRLDDKCESPAVERRFYVGVIPIMLLPFSTSSVWPITVVSSLLALGVGKSFFPRVHERWLVVVQFCVGWMSVSGLNNLNLSNTALYTLLMVHIFDLYWHNRELLPPRPYCELWKRPSRAFKTQLTAYLESMLGDYKVSGLPYPLFTGHVNRLKTIGYCGSMQTKEMWAWRKSFRHDPFIDGVNEDDLTKHGIRFAFSRKRLDRWHPTPIKHLYRNPAL